MTTTTEHSARNTVLEIPLAQIAPSPYQCRRAFGNLDELAASIREHGVMQPVTVRADATWFIQEGKSGGKPAWFCFSRRYIDMSKRAGEQYQQDAPYYVYASPEEAEEKLPRFELIAGERRLRASKAAGLDWIPAMVIDVDDLEAAELCVTENEQRNDLNAIEQAESYEMLIGLGQRETDIAEKLGISQAQISNRRRLLGLPDAVRARVIAGELSATAARALLRWPACAQELMATYARENAWTTKQMESEFLPVAVINKLVKAKSVAEFKSWGAEETIFDRKIICADCPHYRADGCDYHKVCFNPECYHQHQAQARQQRAQKAEEARALVAQMQATPGGDMPTTTVLVNDLPKDSYENLSDDPADRLPGCRADCPHCVIMPYRRYNGELSQETICMDPACWKRLREANRLEYEQELKRQTLALNDRCNRLMQHPPLDRIAAAVLLDHIRAGDESIVAIWQHAWSAIIGGNMPDVLLMEQWRPGVYETDKLNLLRTIPAEKLLAVCAAKEMALYLRNFGNSGRCAPVLNWLLDPDAATAETERLKAERGQREATPAADQAADEADHDAVSDRCMLCEKDECDGCREEAGEPGSAGAGE